MKRLSTHLIYQGIFNPNLRTFDIIMRTEFGTSYNSYLLKGSEKIAIIDGAHRSFSKLYLEELQEALLGETPDYLVVNHTEPDHSGAISALLEKFPKLLILVSAAGAKNLKQILNQENLNIRVVNDEERLSLGDLTLEFFSTPNLHWPDTIMTYCPEEETLFSCDVFGCHYCEQGVLDTLIAEKDHYAEAFRYYYDCIFGPFPKFVQKGLKKLEGMSLQRICPSHGPVLTAGNQLERAVAAYAAWSDPLPSQRAKIPIFYCSAYGNTRRLAEAMKEGVLRALPDASCETYDLTIENPATMGEKLCKSDAFLLGCPTINRDAVPPLWQLLSHFDAINSVMRPCALFGSYGWSGEAFPYITERLKQLKCNLISDPFKVNFVPSEADLEAAKEYAQEFTEKSRIS